MDHIRQFDWNILTPDSIHFVNEEDIDRSCIEKILRNKFVYPMYKEIEDGPRKKIDWDQVLKKRHCTDDENKRFFHVAGFRNFMSYPKLSSISLEHQLQCMKVLCTDNLDILPIKYIQRPTKLDYKVFEDIREDYEKEQKEYQAWARTLWSSGHNIRALRPPDLVENIYEAEFRMRVTEMQCFPKKYEFAAQIPFEANNYNELEMMFKEQLVKCDMTMLPHIKFPEMITKFITILKSCPTPEPCEKHPCRFVLPNEKAPTELPLTEVHKELAQYCLDNECKVISSESALRCILETDRPWTVPISVCSVLDADGVKHNIVVLGCEFSAKRQQCTMRTYKAYRHLLYNTLVPIEERNRPGKVTNGDNLYNSSNGKMESAVQNSINKDNDSSDDEDDDFNLVIDIEPEESSESLDINMEDSEVIENSMELSDDEPDTSNDSNIDSANKSNDKAVHSINKDTDIANKIACMSKCKCKDLFVKPHPRSYSKWSIKNKHNGASLDVIVHFSHKCRGSTGEVILEPIPEYQLDLGASAQSDEKLMSLAMSLYLRRKSSVLNVRVDGQTGEIVTGEKVYLDGMLKERGDVINVATSRLRCALENLSLLLPGHYILAHEPEHGQNALLYVSRHVIRDVSKSKLLEFDLNTLTEDDETKFLKNAPVLKPVLLPYHKYRNILPLAFTPYPAHVAKHPKKTVQRKRTPPKAIKWPTRRSKRKKNINN